MLDDRNAEVGHYLQIADPVATIIDLDPIVLVGYATERDVSQLEIGGPARARLLDGREVVGALRFIAARAETETRTFRIEVEVPNSDYEIRDGLSAELVVPVEDVPAHRVSPAVLTLGPNGEVGVKLVANGLGQERTNPVEGIEALTVRHEENEGELESGYRDDELLLEGGGLLVVHQCVGSSDPRSSAVRTKSANRTTFASSALPVALVIGNVESITDCCSRPSPRSWRWTRRWRTARARSPP